MDPRQAARGTVFDRAYAQQAVSQRPDPYLPLHFAMGGTGWNADLGLVADLLPFPNYLIT